MSLSLESIKKLFEEAELYLDRMDPIQASEKLYKVAEEIIKKISETFGLQEYKEAEKMGRWTARLLFSAVEDLSEKIGPQVRDIWAHAWFLHVEGFHEARLTIELVKTRKSYIKDLIGIAEKYLKT